MKKIYNFLAVITLLTVTACGTSSNTELDENPINPQPTPLSIVGSEALASHEESVQSLLPPDDDVLNEVFAVASPGDGEVRIEYIYFFDPLISHVKILRRVGSPVPSLEVAENLSDVEEVYFGFPSGGFTDISAQNSIVNYYRIWTYSDLLDQHSEQGTQVSAIPDPLYSTPLAEVENVNFTAGDGQVTISFTEPDDPRYRGARVLRKTTNDIAGPFDNSAVALSYYGTSPIVDTGLNNGTEYFYKVFAMALGAQSSPNGVMGSAIPQVFCELAPISNFQVSAGNAENQLSWQTPDNVQGVRIIRNTQGQPVNENDGDIVFEQLGDSASYVDTGLDNGQVYYYAAYSFCPNGFSEAVFAQATPNIPPSGSSDYLKPNNANAYDYFGNSIDVDGDIAVVGASDRSNDQLFPNSDQGAAYVFERQSDGTWLETAFIPYPGPTVLPGGPISGAGQSDFGISVAVEGETIVVGSPGDYRLDNNDEVVVGGSVFIYKKQADGSWMLHTQLQTNEDHDLERFGAAVDLSQGTLVVGAPDATADGSSGFGVGKVFVYDEQPNGDWNLSTTINYGEFMFGGPKRFGAAVSIDGDVIAVGVPEQSDEEQNIIEVGRVAVYQRQNINHWDLAALLKPSAPSAENHFGFSVSVSGNRVAVGNKQATAIGIEPDTHEMVAYVFEKQDAEWGEVAAIPLDDASHFSNTSVDLKGNTLAIGFDGINDAAGAYVFESNGSDWLPVSYFESPLPDEFSDNGGFGTALALAGDLIFIADTLEDGDSASSINAPNNNKPNSGAVFMFSIDSGTIVPPIPYLVDYIKAFDAYEQDRFGYDVDVDGNTMIVGAPDNEIFGLALTANYGSAYIYERQITGQWVNTFNLTVPYNIPLTEDDFQFGKSVAIEGDTIVVSAPSELLPGSLGRGAVYVYERQADNTWQQVQRLEAENNTNIYRQFGYSVDLSGDFLIVSDPTYRDYPVDGIVFVYKRQANGVWELVDELVSGHLDDHDYYKNNYFGASISIDGNLLAVGDPEETSTSYHHVGRVHVYKLQNNGNTWQRITSLGPPNSNINAHNDEFGYSVSVSGQRIAVGKPFGNELGDDSGAVYIYEKPDLFWQLSAQILEENGQAGNQFGRAIALEGDNLIVSAYNPITGTFGVYGKVYAYQYDSSLDQWDFFREFEPSLTNLPNGESGFGRQICLDGNKVFVGNERDYGDAFSTLENPNSNHTLSGAVYEFSLD